MSQCHVVKPIECRTDCRNPEPSITAKSRTPIEKAAAIQAYLSKFRYTLELPSQRQNDPVAFFLFEGDRIICERVYFDAATILSQLGLVQAAPPLQED